MIHVNIISSKKIISPSPTNVLNPQCSYKVNKYNTVSTLYRKECNLVNLINIPITIFTKGLKSTIQCTHI